MIDTMDRRALLAVGTVLAAGSVLPARANDNGAQEHMRMMGMAASRA